MLMDSQFCRVIKILRNIVLLDSPLARPATKRQSVLSFGSRQPDALERVLDMKEHLDKQQRKEEKGQKVVQAETVQTGTVSLFGISIFSVLL